MNPEALQPPCPDSGILRIQITSAHSDGDSCSAHIPLLAALENAGEDLRSAPIGMEEHRKHPTNRRIYTKTSLFTGGPYVYCGHMGGRKLALRVVLQTQQRREK